MKEREFQRKVIRWLESKGAYVVNIWGGGYQRSGLPDLIACYNGKFLGIELKTNTGQLMELQDYNLRKIKESKGIGVVLRPSDFETFKKEVLSGAIFSQSSRDA